MLLGVPKSVFLDLRGYLWWANELNLVLQCTLTTRQAFSQALKSGHRQPCQNVPAAGNSAAFSQFMAACSMLDFTRSPIAGKGTWHLLPTTPTVLPNATKHFDRAASGSCVYL